MFDVKNFTDNNDIRVINELGPFKVIEFIRDLSVTDYFTFFNHLIHNISTSSR